MQISVTKECIVGWVATLESSALICATGLLGQVLVMIGYLLSNKLLPKHFFLYTD